MRSIAHLLGKDAIVLRHRLFHLGGRNRYAGSTLGLAKFARGIRILVVAVTFRRSRIRIRNALHIESVAMVAVDQFLNNHLYRFHSTIADCATLEVREKQALSKHIQMYNCGVP